MITHLRAYFSAIPVKDDEVRLLLRHMAINAVARNRLSYLWMDLDFMAVEAMPGECRWVLLGGVNIVAGQTSHGG